MDRRETKVVHYAPLMIDQFNKKYFLQLDVWSGDLSSTRMVNHFIVNIFLSWVFGAVICDMYNSIDVHASTVSPLC